MSESPSLTRTGLGSLRRLLPQEVRSGALGPGDLERKKGRSANGTKAPRSFQITEISQPPPLRKYTFQEFPVRYLCVRSNLT